MLARVDADDVIAALDAPTEDRRDLVARLEAEAPVEALLGALARGDRPLTRQLAADMLGRRAGAEAGPALLQALHDPDAGVRASAADALGKVMLTHGPEAAPGAGPALLAAYDAEIDPGVRHMLAAALGAAGHREAIRGLALAARWALDRLESS